MITRPWSPPKIETPRDPTTFDAAGRFEVVDDKTTGTLTLVGALYMALTCLRKKVPVRISRAGQDLFVYDGASPQEETVEFAGFLQQFEFCMLNERRAGYSEALDFVAAGVKPPQDAEQDNPGEPIVNLSPVTDELPEQNSQANWQEAASQAGPRAEHRSGSDLDRRAGDSGANRRRR